jgi:hypothetical protein
LKPAYHAGGASVRPSTQTKEASYRSHHRSTASSPSDRLLLLLSLPPPSSSRRPLPILPLPSIPTHSPVAPLTHPTRSITRRITRRSRHPFTPARPPWPRPATPPRSGPSCSPSAAAEVCRLVPPAVSETARPRRFLSPKLTLAPDRKESCYEPRMAPNVLEGHRIDADIVLQESEREAVAELLGQFAVVRQY